MTPIGFQVHPPTLDGAGQAATRIGTAISGLGAEVRPYSEMTNTLGIAATMRNLVPVWEGQFRTTGDEVKQDGTDLSATHENYTRTEDGAAQSFTDIHKSRLDH